MVERSSQRSEVRMLAAIPQLPSSAPDRDRILMLIRCYAFIVLFALLVVVKDSLLGVLDSLAQVGGLAALEHDLAFLDRALASRG